MFDYFAFISYSRRDLRIAKQLQSDLEWFRIPVGVERPAGVAGHRKYIRPVALDKTDLDLRPASFWSDIEQRLERSRYLIVLCSPYSAASENVDREVRHFLLSRNDAQASVIPVIVAGQPHGDDPATECFPPSLRNLPTPLIQRNLPTLIDSTREELLLQVVSFLLDVKFSTINDRYQRERRRKLRRLALGAATVTMVFALIAGYAMFQRSAAIQQSNLAQTNESRAMDLAKRNQELADKESRARGQAEREKLVASDEAERAKRSDYSSRIALAQNEASRGNIARVRALLDGCPAELRRFEWYWLRKGMDTSVSKFAAHESRVVALSQSADCSKIASWAEDNTARVWTIGRPDPILTLRIGDARILGAAISADGKRIALGKLGGTMEVYDVDNQARRLHRWTVRGAERDISDISDIQFCGDGSRLVVALVNPTSVRIYDANGRTVQRLGANGPVATSANGMRLAALAGQASDSLKVNIFDVDSGQQLAQLVGHEGNVTSLSLSADGKRLVSCSSDDTVKTWDAQKGGAALRTITGGGRVVDVSAVAISRDGLRFATSHLDNAIRLWEFDRNAEPIATLRGHEGGIDALLLNGDGSRIASAGIDGTIRVWEVRRANESRLIHASSHMQTTPVAISGDGRRVASGHWDNSVKVWNNDDAHAPSMVLSGHANQVTCVAFSVDGSRIVSGGFDRTAIVWDAKTGSELLRLNGHGGTLNAVAISADNKLIATSGWGDGTLRIWDGEHAGPALFILRAPHREWFKAIALSEDGNRVFAGTSNGELEVFEPRGGTSPLFTIHAHQGEVGGLALSPDAKRIYSCGNDGMIRMWDARVIGEALSTFTGHVGGITALAMSGDGKRIVSCGTDRTIRFWDAEHGGEALLTLTSPELYPSSVVMSRDGMRIASGAFSETVRSWDSRAATNAAIPAP